MTFTDKDLKNLKSRIKEADKQFLKETKLVELTARLEAAELCVETLEDLSKFIELPSKAGISLRAWQKAKGVE